jgi:enoyl-CoA hydratase/carnithine racemase
MVDLVEYRREGHVATITLNRPDKLNAFDAELVRCLAGKLRRFDEDDAARVAVLAGAGKAFSSGADVKARQCRSIEEFERLGGPQEPDAHSGDLLTRAVKWKPVVAAPHGYVMGLAVGIVLECDIVVAAAGTKFQITETPRGLGGARYWGLAHFCGAGTFATEVALTGRFFSAEEAKEAGLISRVCPRGEHLDVARQFAQSIACHPPLSVRSTVRSRRYFMDVFEREIAAHSDPMKLYLTEDFREAVRAHLEKREPGPFHGR